MTWQRRLWKSRPKTWCIEWKPESRKGYRNTLSSFYGWMHATGRRGDDPSEELPKIKRPKPKPRPCPDKYIIAALHKATERERVMVRLAEIS